VTRFVGTLAAKGAIGAKPRLPRGRAVSERQSRPQENPTEVERPRGKRRNQLQKLRWRQGCAT
jgi:hypothetical protein